jgi:hypothetical protein
MKSPVGRMLTKQASRQDDLKLIEVIHRVELAVGEVKVVERRYKGEVLDRAVCNRDALLRARRAYIRATEYVAPLRNTVPVRKAVSDATTRLRNLEKQLVELEKL